MIDSRADLERFLAVDLEMNGLPGGWRARYRLTRRTIYFQRLLRRSEYWANCRHDPVGLIMSAMLKARVILLGERLGMSVPRNVFGPGLSIAHSGLLVINGDTRVGFRCRIHQGVTLAGMDGKAPRIGDDVFIGPNVVVVGGVTIGDGAVLLAGSVVTTDIPQGATAGGVPAKVLRANSAPWYEAIYPLALTTTARNNGEEKTETPSAQTPQ